MIRPFRFVLLAAIAAVLVAGVLAYAQGFGGFRGRGPGGPAGPGVGLSLRGLDLTDAQREQVRQLAQQHRQQTRTLMERLRAAQEARRQAVEATPADEGRIGAAMQELAQVQTQLAVQQAQLQNQIYGLLTTEQQQRLEKMRANREARLKQRQERLQQRRQQQQRP